MEGGAKPGPNLLHPAKVSLNYWRNMGCIAVVRFQKPRVELHFRTVVGVLRNVAQRCTEKVFGPALTGFTRSIRQLFPCRLSGASNPTRLPMPAEMPQKSSIRERGKW